MCCIACVMEVQSGAYELLALVHVVNFYLDEDKAGQVKSVAVKGRLDAKDQELIQGFALEALRKYLCSSWRWMLSSMYRRSRSTVHWRVS